MPAKHRSSVKKIGDNAPLALPLCEAMNANPNPLAVFEVAQARLRVTGAEKEGRDGGDNRVLFAVEGIETNGNAAKTQPALKAQLAGLTGEDRLIVVMHGSKTGTPLQFNRRRELQQLAQWLVDCGVRNAKKICLAVCYAGMQHPSFQGEAGIDPNRAVAFGNALVGTNADGLDVLEIVARKGKVFSRREQ